MTEQKDSLVTLGQLHHIGVVVRDVDKAVEYFTSIFGLGPFTTQVFDMKDFDYALCRGKPTQSVLKAAFAPLGPILIELIEVLEGETPHSEFLREKGEGFQHLGFEVDNIEAMLPLLADEGINPILQYSMTIEVPAEMAAGRDDIVIGPDQKTIQVDIKEVYLESDRVSGAVIQLLELPK